MKVLHIIPSVSPLRGGPSKAILEMVAALNNAGMDVEIATTDDHGDIELNVPLGTLENHHGVPVRFFKRFSSGIRPLREFAYSNSFRLWLAKHIHDYDLIHIHALFSFPSSYAMWLARRKHVKYIVRPIGQLENWSLSQSRWRKQIFLRLFDKQSLAKASAIQFTAESEMHQSANAIPGLGKSVIASVIPLGVRIPEPKPKADAKSSIIERYHLQRDKKTLLFLSRLHPKKGLELVLDALHSLTPNPWQLVIAGNGDKEYIDKLKNKASQNQLNDVCHFIGFVDGDDKHTLLDAADLYVLTSYSENFGIAVLEALAAGTPALVSHGVALSTFIDTQGLGFTCEVEVASVTRALKRASNSLIEVSDRKKITHCVSERYSWETIAESLKQLYQTAISNG